MVGLSQSFRAAVPTMKKGNTSLAIACLLGSSWSCSVDSLPPLGEVIVHVDTDLPAPSVAGRLRIDLYDESGRWFETRDLARPNADDWPVSFSVYVEETVSKRVWVRLRVYPEGKVRSYRGERFQDWPDVLISPSGGDGAPRLLDEGQDVTPADEPAPLLTVDRLVLIEVPREARRHAVVVLRGACAGTMPRFAEPPGAGPVLGQASSCVEEAQQRVEVAVESLFDTPPTGRSQQGVWSSETCDGSGGGARACITGGAMVLGNASLLFSGHADAAPERVIAVTRFLIDENEVSVGDFRAALEQGFVPPEMPTANDGPLSAEEDEACTFTTSASDRESYVLNCVTWDTARALCRFRGGDLPTEAQWEFAATQEGRDRKTAFPWGNEDPGCNEVLFGRMELADLPGYCQSRGLGPVPLGMDDARDVTPSGVHGLAGRMSEWMRDGGASYADACWADSVVNPWCAPEGKDERSVRGGTWGSPLPTLVSTFRLSREQGERSNLIGLRCAYEAAP